MKRFALLLLLVFCFAGSTLWADTISFTYSGSGVSGSGVFIATDQMNGSWLVTGVTGQQNGIAFSGVEPLGTNGSYIYDNQVFVNSTPQLDNGGVLLFWNGGDVNLFWEPAFPGYALINTPDYPTEHAIAFQAALVPEPGTLALMGGGILALAGTMRRKLL